MCERDQGLRVVTPHTGEVRCERFAQPGCRGGGGSDAGYTVTPGQAHYGYQAHVTVDETHMLNYFVTKVSNLRLY